MPSFNGYQHVPVSAPVDPLITARNAAIQQIQSVKEFDAETKKRLVHRVTSLYREMKIIELILANCTNDEKPRNKKKVINKLLRLIFIFGII